MGIFFILASFQLNAATVTSTGQGGNWSNPSTWVGNIVPGEGDDVTIAYGTTVVIDADTSVKSLTVMGNLLFEAVNPRTLVVADILTISEKGSFTSGTAGDIKTHRLESMGSIINNGILDFSGGSNQTGAEIEFKGAENAIFNCSDARQTNLKAPGGVVLNKGTSSASVLSFIPGSRFEVMSNSGSNAPGFLRILNGTFNLIGSKVLINPIFDAEGDIEIPATGGFWLGNQNTTVLGGNGNLLIYGDLKISGGTFQVGNEGENSIENHGNGKIEISGGTLVAGKMNITSGSLQVLGGTVSLANVAGLGGTEPTLNVSANARFEMYGNALIVLKYPHTGSKIVNDIQVAKGARQKAIKSGIIQLGAEATPAGSVFFVDGNEVISRLKVLSECDIRVLNTSNADIENTTAAQLPVIAFDKTAPIFVAPAQIILNCGENIPVAYTSLAEFLKAGGQATDNCLLAESSFKLSKEVKSSQQCPYTLTRTYQVSDASGNKAEAEQKLVISGGTVEQPAPVMRLKSAQGIMATTSITISATGSFIVPAGVTSVDVQVWGGGGAGGGINANKSRGGGGGAGGSFAGATISGLVPGTSIPVTVGVGGTGVSSGNGNSGGNSSFGSYITALGGPGGKVGDNTTPYNSGGIAPTSGNTGGTSNWYGGNGGTAQSTGSGGGGGSAGSTGGGGAASNSTAGSAGSGGGGIGAAGTAANGAGTNASAVGGGGSGAFWGSSGSGSASAGGNGFRGQVIITYTCPPDAGTLSGSQNVCIGGTTTFSSTVVGGTWASVTPAIASISASTGVITGNAAGTATMTYTVAAGGGCATQTATKTVTVNNLPTATISGSATICSGASTTISVALTGSQPWSITYTDGTTPVTVPGISSSPYMFNVSATTTKTYTLTAVSDANCNGTFSGSAVVGVYSALVPGAHNTNSITVCEGYSYTMLSFTTAPSGGNPPYSYQWKLNGVNISGATGSTYTPTITGTGPFTINCTVTDACGTSSSTASKSITVVPDATASISGSSDFCQNGTLVLTANTTGGTGTYTYDWQKSLDGGSTWTSTGSTSSTFSVPSSTAGTYYYRVKVKVSGAACNDPISSPVTITIVPQPTLGTATQTASVCTGSAATINLTGLVSNTTFNLTYTINGGSPVTQSGLVADTSGNSSFTTSSALTTANNGQTLQITGITITSPTPSCSQTFTKNVTLVVDYPPVISCPGATVVLNTSAVDCTATASYTVTSTSQPTASYTYTITGATTLSGSGTGSGTTLNVGTNHVSVTASNACGSSACSFDVIVYDNVKPAISNCPANISVNNDFGLCGATVTWTAPTVSDNCSGGLTLTSDHNSGDFYAVGTTTVTYTATDASGNKSYCTFQILVSNIDDPVISCPANIAVNNATGTCQATVSVGTASATANCSASPVITWTRSDGQTSLSNPYSVGVTTITWKATAGTHSSTCVQTVTVVDNEAPTFVVPNAYVGYTNSSCVAVTTTSTTGNVSGLSDNCTVAGSLSVTYTDSSSVPGTCSGSYSFTRTWKVVDQAGNTTTKTQSISITDNIAPIMVTPSDKSIQCGASSLPSSTGSATATDNCTATGSISITYTDTVTGTTCNSVITRTWKAKDCSGNYSTGIQLINITDTQAPTFSCTDITVATPNNIPTVTAHLATLSATDNCTASPTIEFVSETFEGLGEKPGFCPSKVHRTFRAVDACGNITYCSQTITVTDRSNCTLCNTSVPIYLVDLSSSPSATQKLTSIQRQSGYCCAQEIDNCVEFNILVHPQTVSVNILVDGATPTPKEWNIDCTEVNLGSGSACREITPGVYYMTFTYCKQGNNKNDFTFTAVSGAVVTSTNTISAREECNQNLTVTGVTTPTWTSIYPGNPGDYNQYLYKPGSSVPGSGVTSTTPIFIAASGAPSEIHYQVCGNVSNSICGVITDCSTVTVYVKDAIVLNLNVNPLLICQNNIPTITPSITPAGTYVLNWYGPTGDHVTGPSYLPTVAGTYTVVITDMQSGIPCSTQTQTIQVAFDKTGPNVQPPPAPLTVQCNDPNAANQINTWLASAYATYTNAQGDLVTVTTTNNYTGVSMTCGGVFTVTFTAPDQCTNYSSATSTITVIDTSTPTWTTTAGFLNRSLECSDAAGLASANTLTPTATDSCDPTLTITKVSGTFVAGSCPNSGTYTNQFTARDDCNNASTVFTQVITITDSQPPIWATTTGALDRTVACFDAAGLTAAQTLSPTATDACGVVTLTRTSGPFVAGSCPNSGTYTNVWVARDACGNTSGTYTQVITRTDTQGPVISGTLNTIIASGCTVSDAPAPVTTVAALEGPGFGLNISDLCTPDAGLTVSSTDSAPVGSCPAVVTRTYVVTDVCGNSATVTQTIRLGDTTAPVLTGTLSAINISGCNSGSAPSAATDVAGIEALGGVTISDTCTPKASLTVSHVDTSTGSCPLVITRIYTVRDACNNAVTVTQTINVQDTTAPVLTGTLSAINVSGCNSGSAPSAATDVAGIEALGGVTISDTCTPKASLTVSHVDTSTGSCPLIITRIYTVRDACNNAVTVTQTINVQDATAPSITCPGPYYQNSSPGLCTVTPVSIGTATATDSCGGAVAVTSNAPATFPVGVTTVTWTATDACGNVASCTQFVTIYDVQPPVINCVPTVYNATVGAGNCGTPVGMVTPTYTENCGAPITVSVVRSDGLSLSADFPVGITTVVWTVTDASNNATTCTQTVVVTDNIAPTIACPANVTVTAPPPSCQMQVLTIGAPTVSDNCGTYSLTWIKTGTTTGTGTGDVNGTIFNGGITTVTYTVTDAAGNSASCSFTVTVNDQVPPTIITCPSNVTDNSLATLCVSTLITIPQPTAIDPCGAIVSITHNSPYATGSSTTDASGVYPVGVTTITWTVKDNAGNITTCVQTVTVNDRELPVLSCPGNETYPADTGLAYKANVPVSAPTYGDNCPNPILTWVMSGATTDTSSNSTGISTVPDPYPQMNVGTTVIVYTLTDASGQAATCSFTITITSKPDISCPGSITTYTASNNCNSTLDPGVPTLIEGAQPITWTWTIDGPGSPAEATGSFVGSGSNPGPPAIGMYSFKLGTSTITWTATNISGTDTCTQTVTVIDNIPPVYTPPPTDVEYCVENLISATYDPSDPVDNVIINPDPDYYLFRTGVNSDTSLDLNVANLNDNCCPGTITWTITFSPVPDPANPGNTITYSPVSGTGQPSAYPSNIQIWGDGVNFTTVVHQIEYTVTDCHGNATSFHRDITVKPRPKLTKVP